MQGRWQKPKKPLKLGEDNPVRKVRTAKKGDLNPQKYAWDIRIRKTAKEGGKNASSKPQAEG